MHAAQEIGAFFIGETVEIPALLLSKWNCASKLIGCQAGFTLAEHQKASFHMFKLLAARKLKLDMQSDFRA